MTGNLFADAAHSDLPQPERWFTAHCDGGSRGNPGPSGYGAVIEGPDGIVVAELSEFVGIQTNNFAEYSGLLAVLKWAIENGIKHLRVISDSELMVKQMKGEYKVSSPVLRPLWEQARALSRKLDRFEIRHTLRGGNKEADRLANEAMDQGMKRTVPGASRANPYEKPPNPPQPSRTADKSAGAPCPDSRTWETTKSKSANAPQVLEGYVKDGVVHLLEGELPDGIFVKITRK
jgi:probable phosphoglycerate mutase